MMATTSSTEDRGPSSEETFYQVDLLRDTIEELEETQQRLSRDVREKTRAHDLLQRDYVKLQEEHRLVQHMLAQRERLIADHGLILIHLNPEEQLQQQQQQHEDQDSGFSAAGPSLQRSESSGVDRDDSHSGHQVNSSALRTHQQHLLSGNSHPSESSLHQQQQHRPPSSSYSSSNHANTLLPSSHHQAVHHMAPAAVDGATGRLASPLLLHESQLSSIFSGPALISRDIIELLASFDGSTLEDKLKCMAEEREDLLREIKALKLDLEEERQQHLTAGSSLRSLDPSRTGQSVGTSSAAAVNGGGGSSPPGSAESELRKAMHEYKFRCKRAEQEITILQGSVTRLEGQVSRLKAACDEAERAEEDLKGEKRRILRELRESQSRCDELETANTNLQKRIHKLKETRIACLISGSSSTVSPASSATLGPATPAVATANGATASAPASSPPTTSTPPAAASSYS